MKKALLAVAALLSLAHVAQAQSSVTLYGVVDASVENVKGTQSVTRVSSDNYASSRLGFRGVEDLGSGLKAKFTLESALKVDTGANGGGTARFFDRSAWLGLDGGFGELRLGRIDSPMGLMAGNSNILGAQAYDDFKIAKTWAGDKYRRVDNAITYLLPSNLVSGLTGQLQYTLAAGTSTVVGAEAAGSDLGKGWGVNLQYAAGPLSLGWGFLSIKPTAAGTYEDSGSMAYGAYDFGVAKVIAYYNVDSRSTKAETKRLIGGKVIVPLADNITLNAGVSQVKNAANSSAEDDATILALRLNYNLSKRTAIYGLLTSVDNDNGSTLSIDSTNVPVVGGETSRGLAVGVRHSF